MSVALLDNCIRHCGSTCSATTADVGSYWMITNVDRYLWPIFAV